MTDTIAMIFGCLLPCAVIAWRDKKTYLIDDWLSLPIILSGLVAAIYAGRVEEALLGAGFAFAVCFMCCWLGGMGGGDLKLATGLGMWFSYPEINYVLLIGGLLAFFWGSFRLARLGKLRSWLITFGRGLMLRAFGVRGVTPMGQLPEDGSVPQDAIPFGTCLAIAAWCYAAFSIMN